MGGLISAWIGWGNREENAGSSTASQSGDITTGYEDTGTASATGSDETSDITTKDDNAGSSTESQSGDITTGYEDTGTASATGSDETSDITTKDDNAGSSTESESGDISTGSEDYESCSDSDSDNAVSDQAGRLYINSCSSYTLHLRQFAYWNVQAMINVTQHNVLEVFSKNGLFDTFVYGRASGDMACYAFIHPSVRP